MPAISERGRRINAGRGLGWGLVLVLFAGGRVSAQEAPEQAPAEAAPASVPAEPEPAAPVGEPSTGPTDALAPQQVPAPSEAPAAQPNAQADAELQAALAKDQAGSSASTTTSTSTSAAAAAGTGGGAGVLQSMNPDLSLILDTAAAYFSQPHNLEKGDHDPKERGFNLQQLELAFSAAVDPYFRFNSNIVFSLDGVEIEEAYATTTDLPAQLQVRAGQFLTLFGRINSTHLHTWDFVDQPFAISRIFGGDGNRGLGVELSWLTPLPWYVEVVGSMTRANGGDTARSFLADSDRDIHDLGDFEYVTALKQFFPLSDDWSLSWGLSSAFGPNAASLDSHTEIYGTDLYLKWRPITYQSYQTVALQTEWMMRRRQLPGVTLQDFDGYASLLWRFAMRWAVAGRYEYGTAAYDGDWHPHFDGLDPAWTTARTRVATNVTYSPSEFSRLRLQAAVDLPDWQQKPIWMVFLAFEIAVGAHGAHPF